MSVKRKAGDAALEAAKKAKSTPSITSFFKPPKGGASGGGGRGTTAAAAPVTNFDKQKWVDSLTKDQQELLRLEIDTLHESWLKELKDEITTSDFLDLKRFLVREHNAGKKIFPPAEDVYSWSRHTPLSTVKAVIVGQDPYHNDNQAHGLAFSVRPPTPAPPSLKNIYIGLTRDYATFVPPARNAGLLTPWADRGVLLLNTCLTVRAHEANSHSNRGWERFTQKVIDVVAARRTRGVVFLAWGAPAGKRVVKIDRKRHLVLQCPHPSPLSASRGFFDAGHFKKTNEWLADIYGADAMIDWDLSGQATTLPPSASPIAEEEEEGNEEEEKVEADGLDGDGDATTEKKKMVEPPSSLASSSGVPSSAVFSVRPPSSPVTSSAPEST